MPKQNPVSCRCGAGIPDQEGDKLTKVWFFECLRCGRVAGGLTRAETISMWNAAMFVICNNRKRERCNA